jgi:hypothetical protein
MIPSFSVFIRIRKRDQGLAQQPSGGRNGAGLWFGQHEIAYKLFQIVAGRDELAQVRIVGGKASNSPDR